MKKSMLAITVIILLSAIFASLQATKTTEIFWEKGLNDDKEVFYSVVVGENYCAVTERADGDLDLGAIEDNRHGWSVTNDVLVNAKNGHAESHSIAMCGSNGMMMESDYQVFQARCVDAAMQLPPEVRAKFNGVYGIK